MSTHADLMLAAQITRLEADVASAKAEAVQARKALMECAAASERMHAFVTMPPAYFSEDMNKIRAHVAFLALRDGGGTK